MRVLLFTNLYPSKREPTRGVFNRNRFLALTRHCEARVVSPLPWWLRTRRPGEWFSAPAETSSGIPAVFPTYWSVPRVTRVHGRAMHASLRHRIARLRRDFPFDVILSAFAYPDGVAAAHLARDLGCPLVSMVLGSDVNTNPPGTAEYRQIRWALGSGQRVVAVSQALADRVLEMGLPPERVVVQRNGVDGERFRLRPRAAARRELGIPEEGRLIVYAGNLRRIKGVDLLIEAMARLRELDVSGVRLALAGDGELAEPLRERAMALGLGETVSFLGPRPHAEIPTWFSAADLVCLPSRQEGCPNVVLEALAAGRPVVAARVGGVPELLSRGNGVIVSPEDPGALAHGMREALLSRWDPEALRASVDYLSWDHFGATLRNVLAAAVAEVRGEFVDAAAAPARAAA